MFNTYSVANDSEAFQECSFFSFSPYLSLSHSLTHSLICSQTMAQWRPLNMEKNANIYEKKKNYVRAFRSGKFVFVFEAFCRSNYQKLKCNQSILFFFYSKMKKKRIRRRRTAKKVLKESNYRLRIKSVNQNTLVRFVIAIKVWKECGWRRKSKARQEETKRPRDKQWNAIVYTHSTKKKKKMATHTRSVQPIRTELKL